MKKNKIHLDDLPKLLENPPHNLLIDVYNEDIKVIKEPSVKKPKKNTISERVERLETKVDKLSTTVDKLGITVNKLSMTVDKLAKIVSDGFSELKQDIKDINARLDYIVEANNLKDSK